MQFQIEHLESYEKDALIAELRRVAVLVETPTIGREQFAAHANVHWSTIQNKFGGWRNALAAAGLADRIDNSGIRRTREEVIAAIVAAAEKLSKRSITLEEFKTHADMADRPVRRLFGTWKAALLAAGLEQVSQGKRYTDEECFENLLTMWTTLGRPPKHGEMNRPPSAVGAKAYIGRWGTWRKSLAAFVARANAAAEVSEDSRSAEHVSAGPASAPPAPQDPRGIPLSLRYKVLRRDSFRCVSCGAAPALVSGVVLHVDHIQAWSRGGPTTESNLRTLCRDCNLGKGASPA